MQLILCIGSTYLELVCYAYLHDVPGSSFPAARDKRTVPTADQSGSNVVDNTGNDSNVQFVTYKDNKRSLARTLQIITTVPQHMLVDGHSLSSPCGSNRDMHRSWGDNSR